jgi:hypothetical protein
MARRMLPIFVAAVALAPWGTARSASPGNDVASPTGETAGDPARLQALVEQLGSGDYWIREAAAAELRAMGPPAIDALIAAAETSGDLEVALSARWLVDAIPLVSPNDPPEVQELVGRLGRGGLQESLAVAQQLLRLDDDAGIEPLARIVRLDRSPSVSLVAAALLSGELSAKEPSFVPVSARAVRGFGTSTRPSVAFLRGTIDWSNGVAEGLDRAGTALETLRTAAPVESMAAARRRGSRGGTRTTRLQDAVLEDPMTGLPLAPIVLLERKYIAMLVAAARDEEAAAQTRRLVEGARSEPEDLIRSYRLASTYAWAASTGSATVVDAALADRTDAASKRPIAMYAAAVALKSTGRAAEAESLADEARHGGGDEPKLLLDAASAAARWGAAEWAVRGYETILGDASLPDAEFVRGSVMFAEYLHDLGRDAESAACLRRLLEAPGMNRPPPEELLRQNGREVRSTRSRMLYFEACAAEAKGDRETQGRLLDQAIEGHEADVDALIAAYHHPAGDADRRQRVMQAVHAALERITNEIDELADSPGSLSNSLNE